MSTDQERPGRSDLREHQPGAEEPLHGDAYGNPLRVRLRGAVARGVPLAGPGHRLRVLAHGTGADDRRPTAAVDLGDRQPRVPAQVRDLLRPAPGDDPGA